MKTLILITLKFLIMCSLSHAETKLPFYLNVVGEDKSLKNLVRTKTKKLISNFPNLTVVLEQAKDHCKELIKETKKEIAFVENPNGLYDLVYDEIIEDADTETAKRKDEN